MEQKHREDFLFKIDQVRKIMGLTGCDAVLVSMQSNFAWLTGGRGFIGLASERACAVVLITHGKVFLVVSNIEKQRLVEEELGSLAQEFSIEVYPWHEEAAEKRIVHGIVGSGRMETDASLQKEFSALRRQLTDSELEKYRWLGQRTSAVVEDACCRIRPGITEFEAAGWLSCELWKAGIEPITNLIAFDDRVYQYRHPLPGENTLHKYAMLAVCTRKWGLVVSLSRFVHFGRIPAELKEKHKAVTDVDACLINNTRPGNRVDGIFREALKVYSEMGYAGEWEFHHQGGLTGYMAREYRATAESNEIVREKQAFAWNPSISGTKSEDTILVLEQGNEVITHTGNYPYLQVESGGKAILRPDILIL